MQTHRKALAWYDERIEREHETLNNVLKREEQLSFFCHTRPRNTHDPTLEADHKTQRLIDRQAAITAPRTFHGSGEQTPRRTQR